VQRDRGGGLHLAVEILALGRRRRAASAAADRSPQLREERVQVGGEFRLGLRGLGDAALDALPLSSLLHVPQLARGQVIARVVAVGRLRGTSAAARRGRCGWRLHRCGWRLCCGAFARRRLAARPRAACRARRSVSIAVADRLRRRLVVLLAPVLLHRLCRLRGGGCAGAWAAGAAARAAAIIVARVEERHQVSGQVGHGHQQVRRDRLDGARKTLLGVVEFGVDELQAGLVLDHVAVRPAARALPGFRRGGRSGHGGARLWHRVRGWPTSGLTRSQLHVQTRTCTNDELCTIAMGVPHRAQIRSLFRLYMSRYKVNFIVTKLQITGCFFRFGCTFMGA